MTPETEGQAEEQAERRRLTRASVSFGANGRVLNQVLPTQYAGYIFRSRVEARWAVFFDIAGFDWHYEPDNLKVEGGIGVEQPHEYYLPDFVLYDPINRGEVRDPSRRWIVDVKAKSGEHRCDEFYVAVSRAAGCPVILVDDWPRLRSYPCIFYDRKPKGVRSQKQPEKYSVVFSPGMYTAVTEIGSSSELSADDFQRHGRYSGIWPAIAASRASRFDREGSGPPSQCRHCLELQCYNAIGYCDVCWEWVKQNEPESMKPLVKNGTCKKCRRVNRTLCCGICFTCVSGDGGGEFS